MEEGPAFTKKETDLCKLSCETTQPAGNSSPFQTSPPPPPPYINMSTATSSMMMSPSRTPATSKSSCSSSLQQQQQLHPMISSSCSPTPNHPDSNPNPSPRRTIFNTADHQSTAPFAYRHLSTADQSPASPFFNPSPNPNPNPSSNPSPLSSPNRSSSHPLPIDDRYTAKSPLNLMLIKQDQRQLHEQSLFDHDHQLGLMSTDDQFFGGFRLLPSHVSSPFFSEGLQASWSPLITDYPYMSTQREGAALMSPAPEITGLGDLHEAEMSLFSSAITARRWSLYDESSDRAKGMMDTSDSPSTRAGSATDSAIRDQRPLELLSPATTNDAQNDFHGVDLSPPHHSKSLDGDQQLRAGKFTASDVHRSGAGTGFSGGESEGLKHASPAATEMSSSSASELQDEEDISTGNQYKPVGAQARNDKLDGGEAPDLGKTETSVDNKPFKKPRKKVGQRRAREARVALLTKSEVEHLEDGYRWRKYGQKAVKNSPHPRSYYRCTNSKCFVKKRVERCNEDPSLVVTTYEGIHTHHSPAVLRGSHDNMLDPLIGGPLGTLNYIQSNAAFMPWHHPSSLRPPATHSPSHFSTPPTTTIDATLHQLFRPLHSAPCLLPSKPLSFPSAPFSIPSHLDHSSSLSRLAMAPPPPPPQAALHFSPRPLPHHIIQPTAPLHALPVHLFNPTQHVHPSKPLPISLVDKGLLDDMLSYASTRPPSPSTSS